MLTRYPRPTDSLPTILLEDRVSQGRSGLLGPFSVARFQKQECAHSVRLSLSGIWDN